MKIQVIPYMHEKILVKLMAAISSNPGIAEILNVENRLLFAVLANGAILLNGCLWRMGGRLNLESVEALLRYRLWSTTAAR